MFNFINFIFKYGSLATFIIILIEYACFPISSEIVLPFSGAIANMNNTNFFFILILSIIAGIFGSFICYIIGRLLGNKLLDYLYTHFPKTKKGIDASTAFFDKYGNKAVCIARLIPLCRTYISFVAGAINLNPLSFAIYSTIGISIWNFVLIGLGYMLGSNWQQAIKLYDNYKTSIIISFFVLFLIFFLVKLSKKHTYD